MPGLLVNLRNLSIKSIKLQGEDVGERNEGNTE